ncbi:hypothetical protein M885DRAFT_623065 [Pelagophyceae sp. CCMP2097]|nr:hypothetical protein M885DRAFT_623065 [Pelagophyceae sp. CCMP2097]
MGAVSVVTECPHIVSRVDVIPKAKPGDCRIIVDLRCLNERVTQRGFSYETLGAGLNAGDIDSPEKKARIEAIYSQFAAFDAVLLSRRFEAGSDAATPGNAAPRADVPTATRGDVPLLEQTAYVRVKEGRQVLAPRIGIAAGQTTTYLDLARDAVLHYLRPEDWARVAARPMIVETFSDFHETEASKVEMTIFLKYNSVCQQCNLGAAEEESDDTATLLLCSFCNLSYHNSAECLGEAGGAILSTRDAKNEEHEWACPPCWKSALAKARRATQSLVGTRLVAGKKAGKKQTKKAAR